MRKKSISKDLKGHFLALGQAINTKPKSHKTWKTKEMLNIANVIQNDQCLRSYKLTKTEIYLISGAWYITVVDRKTWVDTIKLVSKLFPNPVIQLKRLSIISSLIKKEIFQISKKRGVPSMANGSQINGATCYLSTLISETISFTQSFTMKLFGEQIIQVAELNPLDSISKSGLELIEVNDSMDKLILSKNTKDLILMNVCSSSQESNKILNEWGLINSTLSAECSNAESNVGKKVILFYGASGTGKTFAAKCISNYLDKKLLTTDMSIIQSRWMGESEKMIKVIFDKFNEINEVDKNPPILILNEADQFLFRRITDISNSAAIHYNNLRNLFLEALERVKGIVIATTNNIDNLDYAFSRRFDLKLEFLKPALNERKRLWQVYLNKNIPGFDKIDINEIAKNYEFTGGQISLVVKNVAIHVATNTVNKKINQKDLINYCELEQRNKFDQSNNRIGFI